MTRIVEVLRRLDGWQNPRSAGSPLNLKCRVDFNVDPSYDSDLRFVDIAPSVLYEMWSSVREAWLFEDIDNGQWGIHLFRPGDSAARSAAERAARAEDFRDDDWVIGEFLGDSDLLMYSPSESESRRISVAPPLDVRGDWYELGSSISEVLERMAALDGSKYWETNPEAHPQQTVD